MSARSSRLLIVLAALSLGQGCPPQFQSQLTTDAEVQFVCTKECGGVLTARYTIYSTNSADAGSGVIERTGLCDSNATTVICVPANSTQIPPDAIDLDVTIRGVE